MLTHLTLFTCVLSLLPFSFGQATMKWKIHDPDRPMAPLIDAGTSSTQETPGRAPSDATVLFDGRDLSQWQGGDGSQAKWKVGDGYMEVAPGTGNISTKEAFGDAELHVEFAEPTPATGESQDRGNSGIFLMGLYEIQVLDSYHSKTYADGQAAAVYGQYPPLVNASRPPGEWQTYDITLIGREITLVLNGQTIIDKQEIPGLTGGALDSHEGLPGPIYLQGSEAEHVAFRNITITPAK